MSKNPAEEIIAPPEQENVPTIPQNTENTEQRIERLTEEFYSILVAKMEELQGEHPGIVGLPVDVEYILQECWEKFREKERLPKEYDIGSGLGKDGVGDSCGWTIGSQLFPIYDNGNRHGEGHYERPQKLSERIVKKYIKLFFQEILKPQPAKSKKDR